MRMWVSVIAYKYLINKSKYFETGQWAEHGKSLDKMFDTFQPT